MNLRFGAHVVSVNLIFLAAAFLFFVRLSYQRLHPELARTRTRAVAALTLVSCTGILGAWLYGSLGANTSAMPPGVPPSVREFAFGSFGGYWGVLLGSLAASALLRTPYLRQADAFIPGLLAGGAVARIADLFTGANSGVLIDLPQFPWFQPFRPWALYDISIQVLALLMLSRLARRHGPVPGLALSLFLVGYGAMRCAIEFIRLAPHAFGPVTYGQVMAAAQIAVGGGLLAWLWQSASARRLFSAAEHPLKRQA